MLVSVAAACVADILSALSGSAWAPTARTIKIVVPFQAGGSATMLARLLADQIGRVHEDTMPIENRPGAGVTIAYEAVARATPDGKRW
jgi:tripartite-type tricarboxylate transporter receptor subunit TctC